MDSLDKTDMIIFNALGCCYNLLYCDNARCLGCAGQSEFLCCGTRWCCNLNAKPFTCDPLEGDYCQCGCYICSVYAKSATSCISISTHFCWCVNQVTMPCDRSIPCMFALFGILFYPELGCFMPFGKYKDIGVCGYCRP